MKYLVNNIKERFAFCAIAYRKQPEVQSGCDVTNEYQVRSAMSQFDKRVMSSVIVLRLTTM